MWRVMSPFFSSPEPLCCEKVGGSRSCYFYFEEKHSFSQWHETPKNAKRKTLWLTNIMTTARDFVKTFFNFSEWNIVFQPRWIAVWTQSKTFTLDLEDKLWKITKREMKNKKNFHLKSFLQWWDLSRDVFVNLMDGEVTKLWTQLRN